jgi:aminoglycoside phosphotransferase (APT) family kinase protein
MTSTNNLLPEPALRWIIDSIGADSASAILSVERQHGGMSSIVHKLIVDVGGQLNSYVLRQFDNAEWLSNEPDLVLHEAESLRYASVSGVQTPKLVAFDDTGSYIGKPAVLMTCLPGQVVLAPEDMYAWVDGLAEALARIHRLDGADFEWSYFTYNDVSKLQPPSWSSEQANWQRVIDIVKGQKPESKTVFIHRDYHPTNVLWKDDQVSGVVDWVNACRGPAGIDVGHCRVNLVQLYGVPTADAFLASYERHAGELFRYEPYWDLLSLMDILEGPLSVYPGWTALGVTGLTETIIAERLEDYRDSLLQAKTPSASLDAGAALRRHIRKV